MSPSEMQITVRAGYRAACFLLDPVTKIAVRIAEIGITGELRLVSGHETAGSVHPVDIVDRIPTGVEERRDENHAVRKRWELGGDRVHSAG